MKVRLLLPLLIPLAALAGEQRIPYACDNGSRIDISFFADADGRPHARLYIDDEAIALPQVPTASGVLYRSGDIRLHTTDHQAILEDGKGDLRRCTSDTTPPPRPSAAAANSFIDLSGHVTTRTRTALPPNAILTIRIQDASRAGSPARTLVEQRYELNGAQLPIPFTATVDRDLLGKRNRLSVAARIEAGGRLRLAGNKSYPARQGGQAAAVEVVLKAPGQRPR